ncbi:uncharacterized protein LOC134806695 [Cydia splendana]|uniref:uncharacterized protein LOC134806695 n=1 Tax=Cydia splendana TaxID=1100963 RepID=UPI00300CA388
MGYIRDLVLNFLHNYLPLNTILFIRAIFGHYFSYTSKTLYLTTLKIYCSVLSFIVPLILHYIGNSNYGALWILLFEYFISIWITLIVENDCFIKYMTCIQRADPTLELPSKLESFRLYINWKVYQCDIISAWVIVSIPAVLIELIHMEVDHISLILRIQYSKCNDLNARAAISKGIRFLKLRPFKFHIWRVIPIDSSLPINFITLVFTYSILILQVNKIL